MKTYEFVEESWYASNGCSCCEPVLMECYNILGDYYTNGSAHSVEDCYRLVLELEGVIDEDLDFDYNDVDFELMCQTYGIKVTIHYDEEFEEED